MPANIQSSLIGDDNNNNSSVHSWHSFSVDFIVAVVVITTVGVLQNEWSTIGFELYHLNTVRVARAEESALCHR